MYLGYKYRHGMVMTTLGLQVPCEAQGCLCLVGAGVESKSLLLDYSYYDSVCKVERQLISERKTTLMMPYLALLSVREARLDDPTVA